jgi:hypothetical protein
LVALGILARLFYRLSRQRFLRLPLDVGIMLLAAAAVLYALAGLLGRGHWPMSPLWPAALGLCGLVALVLRLRRFILFRPSAAVRWPAAERAGLVPFQALPVRASGWFEVSGERRYYVQVPGALQATAMGECVLMVQVSRVSLLGLFPSGEEEWGWWYAFFQPEEISAAIPGRLYFGLGSYPALRLDFGAGRPPAYLAFDGPAERDRVAAALTPRPCS